MRINNDYNHNTHFKSAKVNIVSLSDIHGDILGMSKLMKAIQMNKRDLFEHSAENSTLNMLSIVGDFFMNPLKRGLLTNPAQTCGDVQYNYLCKLIYLTRMAAGARNQFTANYTPGNHCFDGGDEWLFDKLQRAPMTSILTNLNKSRSMYANLLMLNNPNITTEKIYKIADSINPEKIHKMLVLGLTIPSLNYYNPGLLKETEFYNNTNKNDTFLEERDILKTIHVIKNRVTQFKTKNPQGAVVILSHLGNKLSSIITKRIPEINLILNAHDHKEFESIVGKTLILSHGENNHFLRGSQLMFEDDGSISIRSQKFLTEKYEQIARKDKNLQTFVEVNIAKDLVPLVHFDGLDIPSEQLVYDSSIRYSNSLFVNYLTNGMKASALEKYPDLDAVGIPTTIIRGGLKSNPQRSTMNNLDFMKIFDGVTENLALLKIGRISGEELYNLIFENVSNNLKSRTRNALIQWSDIQINRTKIKSILKNAPADTKNPELRDCIKIRNKESGEFENIDFNKEYSILFSDKYLIKNNEIITVPNKIRKKFQKTTETYDSLFKKYLESVNYKIDFKPIDKEERIL